MLHGADAAAADEADGGGEAKTIKVKKTVIDMTSVSRITFS